MAVSRITTYVARAHLGFARARGLSLSRVLDEHGITAAEIDDDESEIDITAMNALWREMERLVGPDYGLLLAESLGEMLGVADYCARHAPDARRSLAAFVAYQRLLHGPSRALFLDENHDDRATVVRFVPPVPMPLPRAVHDFVLARILTQLRRNTGIEIAPRRVTFRHATPTDLSVYRRVFRCPISFHASVDAIELDGATLSAPLLNADPALDAILGRHAAALLEKRPRESDLIADVRRAIVDGLRGGSLPGAPEVARRLGSSPRTLRRRLDEAGASFHSLVDEVRRELAQNYLRDPALKTLEVAFLVGFSEASTFHRAFRRWTGTTPVEYRRAAKKPEVA